ncbi:MAG: ABC transporter ATP-binding protein [Zetaproteobacteria bacterium]|nr:MAG: ABC transporter ATP-binding protein [Zetaproteobacteria bacterium]
MDALVVEDLRKTYRGGKQALRGVSFAVPEGSFFALLGPNGAGKTTLISILADVVRPTGGRMYLFGRDVFQHRRWCKQRIGIVPQEVAFDPFFSVRDVLEITCGLYGVRPDARWIARLLEALELAPHAHKNTRALSGGMRRRLLVAQALVHRPPMAVLDEPTAGVDVELRQRLWAFMQELNREGMTILLTTHYLEEAEALCDHVAILREGALLTARPMRALLDELAAAFLWLAYPTPPDPAQLADARIAPFAPRLVDGGVCLALRRTPTGTNVHEAYAAALSVFGPPTNAEIRREDLEDVFLRLTGNAKEAGCSS